MVQSVLTCSDLSPSTCRTLTLAYHSEQCLGEQPIQHEPSWRHAPCSCKHVQNYVLQHSVVHSG